ncbi:uncharacterized protein VTP21DRAFT_9574 [Calcarisporiella thermophila]|uniref:uncharacterized protein n=1 Tax=Calcarisporiella thermophila TaxID=911321 RepID=UPI003743C255
MVTVPVGFDANGVPFALGFYGGRFTEGTLIRIAHALERETRARRPPWIVERAVAKTIHHVAEYGSGSRLGFCQFGNPVLSA